MSSPVPSISRVSSKAPSTPVRPSPTDHVFQTLITTPAQHPSLKEVYQPHGKGMRVIQQYVNSIPEEHSPGKPAAQQGDIYAYEFVGAVGLRKSRSGKVTIWYHVKWKGFGISAMTWEPEHHFYGPDLEALWAEHGRINPAGKIWGTSGKHGKQLQPYAIDKRGTESNEMSDTPYTRSGSGLAYPPGGTPIWLDTREIGVEGDVSSQGTVQDYGTSKVSSELAFSLDRAQDCPEPQRCPVRETCLFASDQMSTCSPLRIDVGEPSSKVGSGHDEPERAERTFLEEVRRRNSATSPGPSGSNRIISAGRPLATTNSYSDRSEVAVVGASLIAHPTATSQKTHQAPPRICRRTKTGCLSCRRRRKKCDEQRPLCKSFLHHTWYVRMQSI